MHDMPASRQLRQATVTSADGEPPAASAVPAPAPGTAAAPVSTPAPVPTPAPASATPAAAAPAPAADAPQNITIVTTALELQQATLLNATTDIEIRAHLDLRNLTRARNPLMPGTNAARSPNQLALLYASMPLRSIRGNCSDPAAASALSLSDAEAAALLPLKPFQCLLLVGDTWLMVNNGRVWVDNLHLKIARQEYQPILPFITAGALNGAVVPPIDKSSIYTTNVTFQSEHRGTTSAIFADVSDASVYVDDCIVSDWAGFRSPFVVKFQSVFNIRNTLFLNSHLSSELVDVSYEGIVQLTNVTLANVTLERGHVVSTTLNDYQQAIGYYLNYYAEDDEAYDVPVETVPVEARGAFGTEFVIENATMSNCVYLLAPQDDTVYPGCPPESVEGRARVRSRSLATGGSPIGVGGGIPGGEPLAAAASAPLDGDYVIGVGEPLLGYDYGEDYGEDYKGGEENEDYVDYSTRTDPAYWFPKKLLRANDPWLAATRQELPQRPPAPPSWPPFEIEVEPPSNRTSVLPPPPVVPPEAAARIVAPLNVTAGLMAAAASSDDSDGLGGAAIAGIVLGCLVLAVAAALLALWSRRSVKARHTAPSSQGEEAMLVGFPSTTTTDVSRSTTQGGSRLPRGALIPEDYPVDDRNMLNSVMNPSARYEMTKPDPGVNMFGEDLKPSQTNTKSGMLGDASPRSEQPELIYITSTQPSDANSDDSSNSDSVLGPHHRRMMQAFSKPAADPPSPPAPTRAPAPLSPAPSRRGGLTHGGPNGTVDGTIDDGTVDGTIDQTTLSASEAETSAVSPSPLAPPSEIRVTRSADGGPPGGLAPVSEPGDETQALRTGAAENARRRLLRRLDTFERQDLLLGKYQILGRQQQRFGGQAVVQFVRGAKDRRHYAVKFFLEPDAFFVEAALYAACFPEIQKTVSPEIAARAVDVAAAPSGGDKIGAVAIPAATARFLPHVEAVCDGSAGDLVDPAGRQLPPCIVMEKGESLQDWSGRAEPDFFTVLAVLSNISLRLADMHEAGYVHRDLKPANVMWLPRENRWTIIDFGCVAGVGEVAPLSFTLAYAAPEVAVAFHSEQRMIESTPALDAWSLGVMAYEMLSGQSAFDFLTHGRCRVIAQLRGELPLPWEEDSAEDNHSKLGAFKGPVLQLLERDPSRRVSMRRFHDVCTRLFASRTAEGQEGS